MQTKRLSKSGKPLFLMGAFTDKHDNRTYRGIAICECETCGAFISKEEYLKGDGSCYKCWDK